MQWKKKLHLITASKNSETGLNIGLMVPAAFMAKIPTQLNKNLITIKRKYHPVLLQESSDSKCWGKIMKAVNLAMVLCSVRWANELCMWKAMLWALFVLDISLTCCFLCKSINTHNTSWSTTLSTSWMHSRTLKLQYKREWRGWLQTARLSGITSEPDCFFLCIFWITLHKEGWMNFHTLIQCTFCKGAATVVNYITCFQLPQQVCMSVCSPPKSSYCTRPNNHTFKKCHVYDINRSITYVIKRIFLKKWL